MTPIPKHKRLKLSPAKYKKLEAEVHERDGGRCLCCGRNADEKPHHIVYRSDMGSDVSENLASIDRDCHHHIHHGDMYEVVLRMCDNYGPKRVIMAVLTMYANGVLR